MVPGKWHRDARRALVVAAVVNVACGLSAAGTSPVRIEGGRFEASGVAHVPGTNYVLFVDDGREREVFMMELTADGKQHGPATPIPLPAAVTDLEGITSDGRFFYVVGSQSKTVGYDGDGLVRFTFDASSRRVADVERIPALKSWLATHVDQLRGIERKLGDTVLNIEGLAWDPRGQRLLLGLRAPVVDGTALVVPLRLVDPNAPFTTGNLRSDGPALRVQLGGSGIRSIEYDDRARAFRIITGSGANREIQDFRVVEWDGTGTSVREVATYAKSLKPEGLVRATIDGRSTTVIVFDTGRFALVD